ncbi:MAG: metallophosphoesterase [Gemmatimonadaceae bacterium]
MTAYVLWGAAAAVVMVALHAVFIAPFDLRVTRVTAPVRGLSEEFVGYTIVLLADLHYGLPTGTRIPARAVAEANRASPDLVVLLGDYGGSVAWGRRIWSRRISRALYRAAFRALPPVLARLTTRDGVIAVLGNHDYYADIGEVRSWLTSLGYHVLVNECRVIRRGKGALAFGGVDDVREGTVDPAGGCAGVPADVPRVIISHNPDVVRALDRAARADLVLAGHTHGGQVVLPWYGAPRRFCKVCGRHTARGWVPNAAAPLYVSAGVGAWVPLRVNCPPEVVVVRLRRADDQHPE